MFLKEMLQLDIFTKSEIITGNIGMENPVESVMVLEAADIENWGKENQVILTSFYALSGMNKVELEAFLQKMKKVGSSALVIKMDRLIKAIPKSLIDLCAVYQIPLIKIERDLSYEKILLAIYQPILNHQSHILKTYYEVRQTFTKIEKNLPSFQRIMEEFQRLIRRECQLLIPEKNLQIQLGEAMTHYIVTEKTALKKKEFVKNSYELLSLFSQVDSKTSHALKVSSYHPFFEELQLFVYENDRPFDDTDYMIIENLLDILLEKLQMEYLLKKDRYDRLNGLANALLEGTAITGEEKELLLQEAKLAEFPYYQGVAISLKNPKIRNLQKLLRKKLRELPYPVIYHESPNYEIFLYNFPKAEKAFTGETLNQFLSPLLEQQETVQWNITISSLKEKESIHEILSECMETMKFNQMFHVKNCLLVNELGVFRYLSRHYSLKELRQLIPEDLFTLYTQQHSLFLTLACFLRNDKNYYRTAAELFLHPKTVRYRLNKINSYLAVDLENPLQSLNYQIGIYLLFWQQPKID